MSYTILLSDDQKYIVVTVEGSITRKIAMQHNLEAHAFGKKLGIQRYLVDATQARNTESTLKGYQFAYEDMHETPEIDRDARVALLVAPDDHSHDFIETVSKNAGLDVTLFRDRKSAENHLKKD
jgi:hypothetical protein